MPSKEEIMTGSIVTLPICCICKRVSDHDNCSSPVWMKLQRYLDRHHMQQDDLQLSHTYCPACYSQQARAWHLPHLAAPPLKRSA